MRIINLLFGILLLLFNCKQKTEHTNVKIKTPDSINSPKREVKSVYISGETDDPKAFKYVNIIDYSNFNGDKPHGLHVDHKDNIIGISLDSVENPKIMEMMLFGNKFHKPKVFVTPGDSINLVIKNEKLIFNGLNADHYNFYQELDSLDNQWSLIGYKGSFKDYKRKSTELFQKRNNFFERYIKSHKVSKQFINQVRAEIKFEYLYNLIAPRSINSDLPNAYINNLEGLITEFENQSENLEENFLILKDYFGDVEINDFKRVDLINNDYFKRSLTLYIRHYFTQQEYVYYNQVNFDTELNYINNNLEGKIARFARAKVYLDYFQKGFGQDKITNLHFITEIEKYLNQKSEPSYTAAVKEIEEELKLYNFKMPDEILQEKLLTIQGDTIQFKSLLQSSERSKFIVFWIKEDKLYKNCERCVGDILKTRNLQLQMDNDNTEWIYISLTETEQWHKDMIMLKDVMSGLSNYKILGKKSESEMLKYFKFIIRDNHMIELPRHIILDENNNVIFNAVPKAFDMDSFKSLLEKGKIERE
ncbi:hypothetical protein BZARG_2778 [Bizionia argentinensis JUB59]|uniref:Uncharacterized protein n=1 Tax=Bizionia argentinensis JUB59 TaxID=1046627 RepID=G2EFG6_9FLAO|nr:hypothetical protein [Bizionia argentinensis]EGV42806.1 hypothetical protein BZARG_2778 [Bizionia argentinensis JUB59]